MIARITKRGTGSAKAKTIATKPRAKYGTAEATKKTAAMLSGKQSKASVKTKLTKPKKKK